MSPHVRWLVAVVLAAVAGCAGAGGADRERGRLAVRPHQPAAACRPGLHPLGVAARRAAMLYVPQAARVTWPLLVLLHGAGGTPERIIERFRQAADSHGIILLAPASTSDTWDAIGGEPGPDIVTIGDALNAAYDRCAIGPRLAVGGFSDGASYALTLGIANGDLFRHILAFSPCGISSGIIRAGQPRIFISHGREDEILTFARCGEALAKRLRAAGYDTRFEAFIGPHTVPPAIIDLGFSWFLEAPLAR